MAEVGGTVAPVGVHGSGILSSGIEPLGTCGDTALRNPSTTHSALKRLPTFSKLIVYISMRNQCCMDLPSTPSGLQIIEVLCQELNG